MRRKLPALRRALREQFGWEVICTEQVIRLVKEPARAQEAFGIPEFTEVQDYCLLCGVLLLLEDKDDGQRFLLGADPGRAGLHKSLSTGPVLGEVLLPHLAGAGAAVRRAAGCCAALRGKRRLCRPPGPGSAL